MGDPYLEPRLRLGIFLDIDVSISMPAMKEKVPLWFFPPSLALHSWKENGLIYLPYVLLKVPSSSWPSPTHTHTYFFSSNISEDSSVVLQFLDKLWPHEHCLSESLKAGESATVHDGSSCRQISSFLIELCISCRSPLYVILTFSPKPWTSVHIRLNDYYHHWHDMHQVLSFWHNEVTGD